MGDFNSGVWIILLSVYFLVFYLIVSSAISGLNAMEIDNTLRFDDPGFNKVTAPGTDGYTFNGSTTTLDYTRPTSSYSTFKASLSVMTGINSGNVNIGMPSAFRYIISFLFFWIPFFMLIWAVYMAIPFFH